MNRYDMCALLCRCIELTELGEETTFHYLPNLNQVCINHYFGKVSDQTRHEAILVEDENIWLTIMQLDRRIFLLKGVKHGKRDEK